jgi:Cupredoxin-like domain
MGTAKQQTAPPRMSVEPSRRVQRYEQRRARARRRVIAMAGLGLGAVVVVVLLVVVGGGGEPSAPTFTGSVVNVTLGDYVISGNLTAPAGEVRLEAVNAGGLRHNVGVRRGRISGDVAPGGEITLDLGVLAPGTYELYCDLVGHVERGMVSELVITPAVGG